MSKLIRTERTIVSYNIRDKHIVSEENIDSVSLEFLQSIVHPRDNDSLLYEGYILDENQLEKINGQLENKLNFDFNSFYYVLECTGINENNTDKGYNGMTVNERLYVSGFYDEFYKAVRIKTSNV